MEEQIVSGAGLVDGMWVLVGHGPYNGIVGTEKTSSPGWPGDKCQELSTGLRAGSSERARLSPVISCLQLHSEEPEEEPEPSRGPDSPEQKQADSVAGTWAGTRGVDRVWRTLGVRQIKASSVSGPLGPLLRRTCREGVLE